MADIGLDQLAGAALHVQLIGRFALFAAPGGEPLRLPAGKATTVAQVLASRRGRSVSVDTIVDVLWGDRAPSGAPQNAASVVSRLRAVLGAERNTGGRAG